ncbi:hypothetical protein V6N13_045017 [Hibiscus sabdariffa]|uniref:Uncharacterized protein n=1 Tax=Hibiscus sabdariffa TaxID=183260 RepID=A0ABR2RK95_9ROSI
MFNSNLGINSYQLLLTMHKTCIGYPSFKRWSNDGDGDGDGVGNGATSACEVKAMRLEKSLEELYIVERAVNRARVFEMIGGKPAS